MAGLLTAIDDTALSWYLKWIELNKSKQPTKWIKDGMSQPPTIISKLSTCNGQEMSCDVVADTGLFHPEYALAFTISDFEKKLLMH
jgi:hypothetical protein